MDLSKSKFRSRFKLSEKDRIYVAEKGMDVIMLNAGDLLSKRMFPAVIANDGRQTPMRGHPVFIAQHASATCCRKCLAKWHGIPAGRTITEAERERILSFIRIWIENETGVNHGCGKAGDA